MTIEEMRDSYAELETKYNTAVAELDKFKQSDEEKSKRITDLEEYNRKLFMRVSFDDAPKEQSQESASQELETTILDSFKNRKY